MSEHSDLIAEANAAALACERGELSNFPTRLVADLVNALQAAGPASTINAPRKRTRAEFETFIAGLRGITKQHLVTELKARRERSAARSLIELEAERDSLYIALGEAERARDLAIAHDTQPYPTAWAYDQVCRVMHEAKAERDYLRGQIWAVRELAKVGMRDARGDAALRDILALTAEPEGPHSPNGVFHGGRAATAEEAAEWADAIVARGVLTEDSPQIKLARGESFSERMAAQSVTAWEAKHGAGA